MMADEGYLTLEHARERGGGRDGPKEMTPTAWKKPSLIVKRGLLKPPLSELGTPNPWVTTATRMTDMLIKANALAFASYTYQQGNTPGTKISYLCNISIETQRVTNAQGEDDNHSSSIRQQTQHWHML